MEGKKKSRFLEFPALSEEAGHHVRQALFAIACYVIFLIICMLAVSPKQYDLSAGDVAPETITATRDVVDEITTERRKRAAMNAVLPVYYKDDTISDTVLSDMDDVFSELRAVRELGSQIRAGWENENGQFSEADYDRAADMITTITLSTYQLRTLMNTDERDFENLYQSLTSATRTTLVSTIAEGQINDAISSIQQIVAYNTRTDLWYNVAIPTLRAVLQPNMLINQQATEENRQRAYNAIEPTVYKQDQNIVVKGDRVSEEQIAVLDELGLLRGDSFDGWLYAGTAVVVALVMVCVWLYVAAFVPKLFSDGQNAMVMLLASVVTVLLSLLIGRYINVNAMPMMLAAMLVASLVGVRCGYAVNLAVTLILSFLTYQGTGLMTTQMLSVLLMGSIGGMAAVFLIRLSAARVFMLVVGLAVGVIDFVILLSVEAMTHSGIGNVLACAGHAAIGALTSALLCVGLQPMMETAFNLVSPAKLIELSSPNQPLLRRLMIEAPGTYHHAMIVANLAEAAAEAIGADALLVRVGAYYHDIGKLTRPQYFKENQMGDNPHDKTDPSVSTVILTEHTRDGVELGRKYRLPEPILDMIRQHHGDSLVMYFYAKAVKKYGEENVNIDDFRYDGPKPQTAEAAILMMADTVEAAVRSMKEPTQEEVSEKIHELVHAKIEDGQLDECPLTLRDIGKICTAFETSMQGAFHKRIEYPDIELSRMPQYSRQGEQAESPAAVQSKKKSHQ